MNDEKTLPTAVDLINQLQRDRRLWTTFYVVMAALIVGTLGAIEWYWGYDLLGVAGSVIAKQ